MATSYDADTATPDRRRLTTLQAQRFAKSANIPTKWCIREIGWSFALWRLSSA